MKTNIFKKQTFTLLGTFLFCFGILAQGEPFRREINREFTVNKDTRLELINKYGNVDVNKSDNNSLSINVVIKIDTRDRERAEDMLNDIHITISKNGDVIRAETDIDDNFGRFFRGIGNETSVLEINYTVTMPNNVPLNLSNKYGNVFIDEIISTSTIEVKYGNLTANRIVHRAEEPLTKLLLSYSSSSAVEEARWLEVDMKYSKLNITNSRALAILSKYSKIYIANGTSIVSESKYDTYELGTLNNFVTNAAYGHFEIRELASKLQMETKYSDVTVRNIQTDFENITVNNSYGTYRLGIDPTASYRIDSYSKYCHVDYPEHNSRVSSFNENNEQRVNGTVGSKENPQSRVSITSKYGNIKLVR